MGIEQTLLQDIKNLRDGLIKKKTKVLTKEILRKGIELINWVLENMKNPDVQICDLIESRMKETVDKVNKLDSIFEADPLHTELRILD